MSDFSEYLRKHIKNQNLTLKEIAENININYSLLSRYMNGNRLPKNIDVVNKIADYLKLDYNDSQHLCKLYYQEKNGEDVYEAYNEIFETITELDNLFLAPKSLFPKPVYTDIKPLDKKIIPLLCKQDIVDSLSYSLIYFSNKEKIHLYSIMQPNAIITEALINHPFAPQIDMKQIVCLDRNSTISPIINLATYRNMMSLAASAINQEFYYYFDPVHNYVNRFNLMPNFIITEDYAIRFDNTLSYGELITNPEQVNFFKKAFDKKLEQTTRLSSHFDSAIAHTQYLYQNEKEDTGGYAIHSWPCMGFFLSADYYEKYLIKDLPNRRQVIDTLTRSYNYTDTKTTNKPFVTFLTISGLEEFLQTGIIKEFPIEYYTPLEKEDRLEIIDRTIESIDAGWYSAYIAKDSFVLPEHLGIVFTSPYITLKNTAADNIPTYIVKDLPFYNLLQNFMAYCIENNYVYSREESRKLIIEARKGFT